MTDWTPSMGSLEGKDDDDVLRHISYFDSKAADYDGQGEEDAAAQCRDSAEKYKGEARRRGLISPEG